MIKEELKQTIDKLKQEQERLQNEIENYNKSKEAANNLIEALEKSNEKLLLVQDGLNNSFTVDSKPIAKEKIKKSTNDIDKTIKELKTNVIIEIDNSINQITSEIKELDVKIESLWQEYNAL